MRLAVNYEFSVFLCAPSRSCGLSSRWWKRGRREMFMKTQQTPIFLSSGIWCVTLSAILVCFCFFYGNTFEVCFNIFQGAHFYFIGPLDFSLVFGIQALLLLCAYYQGKCIIEIWDLPTQGWNLQNSDFISNEKPRCICRMLGKVAFVRGASFCFNLIFDMFNRKKNTNVRMYLLVSINLTSNLLSFNTYHYISG